ncbi:endo-alpha-N-acetylgalactosaminidase family protein [Agromyces sp. H3Y2-19a]|uniref:endo-alpha-N-acetylgalactosaminidase family protein n=1 Tax=Agromyces chromiiresistens TaxID=3030835 RepID=UPI0023B92B96|nr:endo-alpha-N-acetylgalactosaminidase family protein [Agromyces chromiiresistens]MDF0513561.1 endo-alpha-N-acetylgalactosaminidase family protein [Agromyces chromiiresistens]
MPSSRPPGRLWRLGLGCAIAGGVIAPLGAVPAQAAPLVPDGFAVAVAGETFALQSRDLAVTASAGFPQVVAYTDRESGATMHGNDATITSITINGTAEPVEVASRVDDGDAVDYVLTPSALDGVSIEARLSVKQNVVTIDVTKITDPDGVVKTLQIPNHRLVTVSSDEAGAAVAAANLSVDRNVSGDVFLPVTAGTPLDAAPKGSNAIIANTGELAAAFATNALYDTSSGPSQKDAGNFWRQAVADGDGDGVEVGIASGPWLYRAQGSSDTEELPWVAVAITPDANGDDVVDWQDGAIAMRDIRVAPNKGDQTPENVITHIPFNFASQATHPFLRTLDDVKRIALNTDGLGQVAMLKGFTSEGHDSANTDYGDNFNERAGGLDELNAAVKAGKKWNASFGVHLNATEIYPEANSFSDEIANENSKGWNWLDQSYYIDQRYDRVSGELDKRIGELADATDDNLDFAYIDVYYEHGWLAQTLQDSLVEHGFRVGSEWADKLAENNTWSHWANDENYGGSSNKGVNSQILRFVNNTQSDVWNPHPLLGTSHIVEFEGWTGQNDFPGFLENVWTANVPAKFLQHHEIRRWAADRIDFEDGVSVTGTSAADRVITVDGTEVLRGDTYLLPWSSKAGNAADKLYHYSPAGGQTTWQLTDGFADASSLQLFALGDEGRTKVADLPVTGGAVTIDAEAGRAYVLVPGAKATGASTLPKKASFGQGTPVQDPGFNETDLDGWNPQGAATVEIDGRGRRAAVLGAGEASISQRLGELAPGTYAVSADLGVAAGRTRPTTLSVDVAGDAGKGGSTSIDSSGAVNLMAADEWRDTTLQRLRTYITVTADTRPTLTIAAGDGEAPVRIDNVRVVSSDDPTGREDVLVDEDFEQVDQGWGPFFKGDAGGSTDPRTHIAKRNEPFTQQGWNGRSFDMVLDGDFSLMAHEENRGLVYRTSEYTAPFVAGHRYRVSFDYQSGVAGAYSFVTGVDQIADGASKTVDLTSSAFDAVHETTEFVHEFDAPACGDPYIGLRRNAVGGAGSDLILDNLRIVDLGESETSGACARLALTAPVSGLVPGEANAFTTAFTNHEPEPVTQVATELVAPEGWKVAPVGAAEFASVAPGATVKTTWRVSAPADIEQGSYEISASTGYTVTGGTRTVEASVSVPTLPPGLIPQSRLSIAGVSDAEPGTGDGSANAAIDGNAATMWHSAWSQVNPDTPYPHWIALDLGDSYAVDGFDYQVRRGNGSIKQYELYLSTDGKNWGSPVKAGQFASTAEVQHLSFAATDARYVKLVGLNAINGAAFAGANELNVWGTRAAAPTPLPKDAMTVVDADSEETEGEDGHATNVIDGDPASCWHSEWLNASPAYPHHVSIDLGGAQELRGISIQQRPGTEPNGRIKGYEVYVSADGEDWGDPVASGELATGTAPQPVMFDEPVTAGFVKVVAMSSHNGQPWASIAELEFFGAE